MKKPFSIISLLFFSFILFAEKPIVRDIQAEAGKGNKINIYWTLPENPEKEIPLNQFLEMLILRFYMQCNFLLKMKAMQ